MTMARYSQPYQRQRRSYTGDPAAYMTAGLTPFALRGRGRRHSADARTVGSARAQHRPAREQAHHHPADDERYCRNTQRGQHRQSGQVGQQRHQRSERERDQRRETRRDRRGQAGRLDAEFLAGAHGQRGVRVGAVAAEGLGKLGLLSCGGPGRASFARFAAIMGARWRVHRLKAVAGFPVS
jgi:hypothetical protein